MLDHGPARPEDSGRKYLLSNIAGHVKSKLRLKLYQGVSITEQLEGASTHPTQLQSLLHYPMRFYVVTVLYMSLLDLCCQCCSLRKPRWRKAFLLQPLWSASLLPLCS